MKSRCKWNKMRLLWCDETSGLLWIFTNYFYNTNKHSIKVSCTNWYQYYHTSSISLYSQKCLLGFWNVFGARNRWQFAKPHGMMGFDRNSVCSSRCSSCCCYCLMLALLWNMSQKYTQGTLIPHCVLFFTTPLLLRLLLPDSSFLHSYVNTVLRIRLQFNCLI